MKDKKEIFLRFFILTILWQNLLLASFSGTLIDDKTLSPIEGATVSDSNISTKSDDNGFFKIDSSAKELHVKAYGYRPYKINGENNSTTFNLKPLTVKGLYLSFWRASNNSPRLRDLLKIIEQTEVNTIIVDVKNEYGSTSYKTSFKEANSYGAHEDRTNRDINHFIKLMKSKNIYTIARIVTFKDEIQASNNPDYAIKNAAGDLWRNHDNMAWVDPFDKRSHEYTISIAEEAAKVGFDEINFDYIRFPAKDKLVLSKENTQENRIEAISGFLKSAGDRLRKYGVFISVDTYGNICWEDNDIGIGQKIESLMQHVDYISPMLYPSGFSKGSFGFKYPAEHPYAVIYRSIKNIEDRVDSKRVRPWLQSFQDYAHTKKIYSTIEINEQIRATIDTNTSGWMLWSPSSKYKMSYFIRKEEDALTFDSTQNSREYIY